MEQLPIAVLKGCPCVGVSLCSLHVPSGFGRRAGFDVNKSRIFPQSVLVAIVLVGSGAGDGGAEVRARYELELLLCPEAITAYWVWDQVFRVETLRVRSELVLFPLSVCSPTPSSSIPVPEGSSAGERGASVVVWCGYGYGLYGPGCSQRPTLLLMQCLCKCQYWLPPPYSDIPLGLSCFCAAQLLLSLPLAPVAFTLVWSYNQEASGTRMVAWVRLGHVSGWSPETYQERMQFQSFLFALFWE